MMIDSQLESVRDSFFRAMAGRVNGSPAAEFGRVVNGIAVLRASGVAVTGETLWGASDFGRCEASALPIWRAVAGALASIGE
jgi:hypothetical protein